MIHMNYRYLKVVILELGIRNSIVYHDMADCKLKITEGRRRRIQFLNSASQRNALVLSWTGIPFIVTFPEASSAPYDLSLIEAARSLTPGPKRGRNTRYHRRPAITASAIGLE